MVVFVPRRYPCWLTTKKTDAKPSKNPSNTLGSDEQSCFSVESYTSSRIAIQSTFSERPCTRAGVTCTCFNKGNKTTAWFNVVQHGANKTTGAASMEIPKKHHLTIQLPTSTIFLEFSPGKHFRTSTPWNCPMNLCSSKSQLGSAEKRSFSDSKPWQAFFFALQIVSS